MPSWLLGLVLAALFSCLFSGLATNVWTGEGFAFDRPVMEALHSLASPWLTTAMRLITASASGLVTVVLALGLIILWLFHTL